MSLELDAPPQPGLLLEHVDACLAGDEAAARAVAGHGVGAYGASKLALARWVRRHAVTDEWIGAGIRLNAICPGFIDTPMTVDSRDFILGLGDLYPIPIGRAGPGRPRSPASSPTCCRTTPASSAAPSSRWTAAPTPPSAPTTGRAPSAARGH